MWPNPEFPTGLVTFIGEIFNGKPHFLCSIKKTNQKLTKLQVIRFITILFVHKDASKYFGAMIYVMIIPATYISEV